MKTCVCVCMALFCVGAVLAQEEGMRQRKPERERGHGRRMEAHGPGPGGMLSQLLAKPEMRERLGISEEQADVLQERVNDLDEQQRDLESRCRELARKQGEMMRQPDVDKVAVFALVEELGALRTQMAKLRMEQVFAVREVLGPDGMRRFHEHRQKSRKHK
jgi:Spy/CpxP family protein refolding chaperone